MSLKRILAVLAKDLKLARRSALFWGVIASPFVITVLCALLHSSRLPGRVAVLDHGQSRVVSGFEDMDRVGVYRAGSVSELTELVASKKVDAGFVFTESFDEKVRAGERPPLRFYVSGEAHALKRLVLAATTVDLLRKVEGRPAPVNLKIETFGGGRANITNFIVLFLTFYVTMATGVFVPALQLIEDRARGTLRAFLVTPARMSEVLIARAAVALFMCLVLPFLALVLNLELPAGPGVLLVPLAVSAVLCTELGLVFGTVLTDTRAAGAVAASLELLVVGAMFVRLGIGWDPWLAKLIPAYWVVGPVYEVAVNGAGVQDVKVELVVGLASAAALALIIVVLGRRMEAGLAAE